MVDGTDVRLKQHRFDRKLKDTGGKVEMVVVLNTDDKKICGLSMI